MLLGSTLAYAAPPAGPTRGEANAAFQSNFTGGFAIRTHNFEANGAPGGPAIPTPDSARIYPGEPDLEYCAQGWHVITLGVFDEVRQSLSTVDLQFALDGVALQTERTAIKKLQHPFPDFSEIPLWAESSSIFSITATATETSVVCAARNVPNKSVHQRPFTAFEVEGPLDFALTGILAELLAPLAAAEISVFTLSTFDTDWILVPGGSADRAEEEWRRAGHEVSPAVPAKSSRKRLAKYFARSATPIAPKAQARGSSGCASAKGSSARKRGPLGRCSPLAMRTAKVGSFPWRKRMAPSTVCS